jgi:hypothetical protein
MPQLLDLVSYKCKDLTGLPKLPLCGIQEIWIFSNKRSDIRLPKNSLTNISAAVIRHQPQSSNNPPQSPAIISIPPQSSAVFCAQVQGLYSDHCSKRMPATG